MNRPLNELNKKTSLATRLFLAATLMSVASISVAEKADTDKDADAAYVDSVFKWGAWELDIEPAAGGISVPSVKPLNARGTKVALRTNSIAALAPPADSGATLPGRPPGGTPIPPPVIPLPPPSTPGITPVSPNVPIPVGGPGGGGAAPAPTITTISPNVPIPAGGPGNNVPSGGPGAT